MFRTKTQTPKSGPSSRSMRGLMGGALVSVALMAGSLFAADSASATSLSATPTFGCYRTSTGGIVQANDLHVNLDGRTTVYLAYAYRWNGTGWAPYALYNPATGSQYVSFTDDPFGELSESPVRATLPHGYYQVLYFVESTGDTRMQPVAADLVTSSTWYNSRICQV